MKKSVFKVIFWVSCLALISFSFQNCSLYTSEAKKAFDEQGLDVGSTSESSNSFVSGLNDGNSGNSASLENGQFYYENYKTSGVSCASCHGVTGMGNGPTCNGICPPIAGLSGTIISDAIFNGPGAMPSYNPSLFTEDKVRDLEAYIQSL